jgi:heavy metal-(Cd/Co/Hg/Pb/Zn)-translocating P-type ATPase
MNRCTHCDEDILIPIFSEIDTTHKEPFCCNGCLTVFNVINFKGLEQYYEIKKASDIFKRRSPVETKQQRFSYLDAPDFLSEYTYLNLKKQKTMEFYLEGIHCLACLWLIEKMPEFLPDVEIARLDMQKSVATISIKEGGKFSHVARELNNLGYKPHPLQRNQSTHDLKKKEDRRMLLKIGIAGAGAGNIMLYAVSNYAGAPESLAKVFNVISVLFALPVFFYSATPFYKTAWNAVKNKTLSIDVPIAMSLIMGVIMGIYNLATGVPDNYFDSLTALVFLLLISRYFLNKIQNDGLTANDLNFFYEGNSVLKKNENGEFNEVHPKFLKAGDIIKVGCNEMIPADGKILSGESLINSSLLTGESRPESVTVQSEVFSGTINLTNEILILVEKTKEESRIGKILKQVENGWLQKSHIVDLTNLISKYFIAAVFLLAGGLFTWLFAHGHTHEAIERGLTLLIVTCPCAMALATPMTLTRTLSRSSRKGMIIKNNEVIEKLSEVDSVFLDKTGTVTYGMLKVDQFNIVKASSLSVYDIIASLEKYSSHPVAGALKEFATGAGAVQFYDVENYIEVPGIGVEGKIIGSHFEIRNGKIFENGEVVASFTLLDHIRPDSRSAVETLKSMNVEVKMLSGDQKDIVNEIAADAGIKKENRYAEMSPEQKLAMIEKNPHVLMVGDGANDAMALSRSYVSVAVLGSLDISLRAADIYLTTAGISHIPDLITISKETMKVIKRNLILSAMYNCVSVYAAFAGFISPLTAAIIMPLSSLTVLISTLIGTRKLNAILKNKETI